MSFSLRPYQSAAIQGIYNYFQDESGNPLVVIPTAGGKSLVMATFVEGVLKAYPDQRILIVTHDARINEFADRIVHMENGRVTAQDKASELKGNE